MTKEELIKRINALPVAEELRKIIGDDKETTAKVFLLFEDKYNWGVDCPNCAVYLNKLYELESRQ